MRLRIVLTLLLQVARVQPLVEVVGYLGDSAILPTGADLSRNLSMIRWALSDSTWIATYVNKKENLERTAQYKGRLAINRTTGDLTIHNLTREDARNYKVTLAPWSTAEIRLKVRSHLRKPTIRMHFNWSEEGGCWVGLSCSSQDDGVDLSWQVEPLTALMSNAGTNSNFIVAFLNATQHIDQVTCTSSWTTKHVASAIALQCDVRSQPVAPKSRDRSVAGFLFGLALGLLTVVFYIYRATIRASVKYLRDKMCTCEDSPTVQA